MIALNSLAFEEDLWYAFYFSLLKILQIELQKGLFEIQFYFIKINFHISKGGIPTRDEGVWSSVIFFTSLKPAGRDTQA